MATFSSYAPPFVFGPWQDIASHLGSVTYTIQYAPVGDANAFAKVKYSNDSETVEQEFFEKIVITTGNVGANVWVQFKAPGPTGVSVQGDISP